MITKTIYGRIPNGLTNDELLYGMKLAREAVDSLVDRGCTIQALLTVLKEPDGTITPVIGIEGDAPAQALEGQVIAASLAGRGVNLKRQVALYYLDCIVCYRTEHQPENEHG